MNNEQNKALVRKYYEQGTRNPDLYEELLAPDAIVHFPGLSEPIRGRANFQQYMRLFLRGFPDLRIDVEDLLAEGDKVIAHLRIQGTHQAEFQRIPPTGKQFSISSIDLLRLEGGMIAEEWDLPDLLGLMQQIGAIPAQ